ncbi:MAG: tRNA (guanosine(37)-N1)-methyltransferase TrmD [Bacteroidota bacterium]|nr:tRNA (guanosine(37)-N1)-methyltransferase TrmD [Bacteroidota bacterium]MEC8098478.1 tRNA (guanosine(37)-N1)-methyltransferase TrmD [Bacteroidota bacterium]MEC8363804.1 tRNA (guanosine(37)-N1)-methyltransferase TrmD [Bacteroidota bacterium]MED5364043.1 tRNA (guanosine(37)-N1)-methyltransferase TrmD [Bacteroidota bacterium]|tara:strand:+ start:837 stop:1502 length:666 start_codon:yes stop_codon:yes gene_type:complete
MRIDIISVIPELISSPFSSSIIKRAIESGVVKVHFHNLRDYSKSKHKKVDDYQYGGGPGMVLMIEPIENCLSQLKSKTSYDAIVLMTPSGKQLDQKLSNKFSLFKNIIIICGHYKGVDQRVKDYLITHEVSIGNYVLTGGELPAAVFCDSIIRLLPGGIGNETSALNDSFQDGLISAPIYTRPENYKGMTVPKILLSGNSSEIEKWRDKKSIELSLKKNEL